MPVNNVGGATVITGNHITLFQMLSQRGALKLEILGMKRRGRSAYSIVKEMYNLKGNKEAVYQQLCDKIDQFKRELEKAEAQS